MNAPECKEAQMSLNNRQEDVHEFILKILEHFDEELTVIAEVFNLPDVFNIFLRSTTTCQLCSYTWVVQEYLWLLTLHFPLGFAQEAPSSQEFDIYSLMDTYFNLEMLTEHPCSQCGLAGGTGKKLDIIQSPQVLLIHISRFDSALEKIDNFVNFTSELRTEYFISGDGQILTYKLRGLIIHLGSSIANGHYVAYVLNQGIWYKADDMEIMQVTWQRVSRVKAYILVYQS